MFRKSIFLVSIVCLTASLAFSQSLLSESNRSKSAIVIASDTIDAKVILIEGNVVFVHDGDNISVAAKDGKMHTIRLQGIDAPENQQLYGDKSRQRLAAFVQGMDVTVLVHKKDVNERYVGSVFFAGEDIGLRQIATGMAWHFKPGNDEQNSLDSKLYAQVELAARNKRTGLWEDNNPVPPWDFRDNKKTLKSNSAASLIIPKKIEVAAGSPMAASTSQSAKAPDSSDTKTETSTDKGSAKTYILGPRGGCYYLSQSGYKVYVKDKSLCVKP